MGLGPQICPDCLILIGSDVCPVCGQAQDDYTGLFSVHPDTREDILERSHTSPRPTTDSEAFRNLVHGLGSPLHVLQAQCISRLHMDRLGVRPRDLLDRSMDVWVKRCDEQLEEHFARRGKELR